MHFTNAILFISAAAAVPYLSQRDASMQTVTTWEVETVTSYTTIWVGMPSLGSSKAAQSTSFSQSSSFSAAPTKVQPQPQPITAVQQQPAPVPTPFKHTEPVLAPPAQTPATPVTTSKEIQPTIEPASPASLSPAAGTFAVNKLVGAIAQDGPCLPGSPCRGDITHYNPSQGVGACGPRNWVTGEIWQDTDIVVAISINIMGSQSNGGSAGSVNPLCNRRIHIKAQKGGQNIVAAVVDKCAGCAQDFALDLSPAAFQKVAPNGDGRVHNVEWYWV